MAAHALPLAIFLGFGMAGLSVMMAALKRFYSSVSKVRECYARMGVDWDYMSNHSLRLKLAFDPGFSFVEDSDSPELKGAKEQMLLRKAQYNRAWGIAVVLFVCGFISIAIVSLMQLPVEKP